ncbi:hypothetical protein AVEN_66485-1 [Araneus ventricosus]|uniref:Uncharacterized protein n=1 Tax=Araneus ventricosus TaxID=182803 RepID=A0A4Y2LCQ0_ARAVE|nr:hypothetical protein AVEN_66485-1 [Araneus ventricosus]
MAVGTVRIARKLPSFPKTSGRSTLTKKARAAGVKSITLNERGWKFQSGIRTFRTAVVFCLKARMGRSRIDRVKGVFAHQLIIQHVPLSAAKSVKRVFSGLLFYCRKSKHELRNRFVRFSPEHIEETPFYENRTQTSLKDL